MKRAEAVQPASQPQWGKMNAAQMLAHMNNMLEVGLGTTTPLSESNFLLRLIVKPLVLGKRPFGKNAPTAKSFRVTEQKDFVTEKQKFIRNLNAAHANGLTGTWHLHVSFGPLTPEEWGRLIYKHTDHHLNQFSC
jgi:hypothetical protein